MLRPNRRERRERLAVARSRRSWDWTRAPLANLPAWGAPISGWVNDLYSVQEYAVESAWGEVRHFAIRRHDGDKDIPWADKQRIKNDLAGSERIALEVFPAEAELVDEANLYHLWILPPGMSLPFSLHGGAS